MRARERRLGRIFHLEFDPGDDFFGEFNRFVKEKDIRAASVFVFGALERMDMASGFETMEGFRPRFHAFEDWRELLALGSISWPDEPPPVMGDVAWDGPQPYVHLHLAVSGGPGRTEEVLVGHLSGGTVKGMFADIYELV